MTDKKPRREAKAVRRALRLAVAFAALLVSQTALVGSAHGTASVDATLQLFFGSNGSGTVTSSPPGISCTASCKATFPKGTKVTLTAKPNPGSAIDNWPNTQCEEQGSSLAYNGPTCTFVLTSDKSATVYFTS